MNLFLNDFRHGFRVLGRSPWFAATVVLILALCIGASTAIFSAVNAVLLRPLPFSKPEHIVSLWENNLREGHERNPASPPNFIDWQQQSKSFGAMAAFIGWNPNMISTNGAERLQGARVSTDMFRLLGVNPVLGRYFGPSDAQSRDTHLVVISYGLWRRLFSSDPNVTNQKLNLNSNTYSIIGVMPRSFQFPLGAERTELWAPLIFDNDDMQRRAARYLQVVARLRPGVSVDQARSELVGVARRIEQQYPEANNGWSVTIVPLYDQLVAETRPTLFVMLGAVGLLLLIGCANVANLLLARASGRQPDMAVRVAIGASRSRIVRQLLTEGLVLSVLGGALGIFLAATGVRLMIVLAPDNIPRLKEVSLDAWVLAFSIALSLCTTLIFGLFPALYASNPDTSKILKESGKSVTGGMGVLRFRSILVVAEIALALVLLVGAGLMIKSFIHLAKVNSGFQADRVLTAQITLPSYKYKNTEQQRLFFDSFIEQVEHLPGVQAAGAISYLPLSGSNMEWVFSIQGRAPSRPNEKLFAEYRQVSAHYFRTMGIPLSKGRMFSSGDIANAVPVIAINEAFARQYFPNEEPLHKRIGFGLKPEWREIVGVMADVKQFGLDKEAKAEAYVPYQQDPWPSMALVVRSDLDPTAMANAIKGQLRLVDRYQPLYQVQTMESLVAESVASRRLAMLLLSVFSGVALVLAAIGVFGVMANSVSQRTHEIGIRMALGARPEAIRRMIVFQAATMALVGISVGLVASISLTRFISSLLYDVSTTDPIVFELVALTLTLVLIVASYIPARRATAVALTTALRNG